MDGRLRRLPGKRQNRDEGITNEITAADSPGPFVEDTPTATLVREVLGAASQFENAMMVAKLRLARDRHQQARRQVRGAHEERPEAGQRLHKQGMGYRPSSAERPRKT